MRETAFIPQAQLYLTPTETLINIDVEYNIVLWISTQVISVGNKRFLLSALYDQAFTFNGLIFLYI